MQVKVKSYKRSGKTVCAHTRTTNKAKKRNWLQEQGAKFRENFSGINTHIGRNIKDSSNIQLGRYAKQPVKFSGSGFKVDENTGKKIRTSSRPQLTKTSPNTKKNYLKKRKK
jgi:hypothetical protein